MCGADAGGGVVEARNGQEGPGMKLLKILVVASLVGIVCLQTKAYLSPPASAPQMSWLGRQIAERVAPDGATAEAGRGLHLR
jgi:hypothetical protein